MYFLNLEDPQPKDIEDLHAAYTRDLVRKETSVAPERNESGSRGRRSEIFLPMLAGGNHRVMIHMEGPLS